SLTRESFCRLFHRGRQCLPLSGLQSNLPESFRNMQRDLGLLGLPEPGCATARAAATVCLLSWTPWQTFPVAHRLRVRLRLTANCVVLLGFSCCRPLRQTRCCSVCRSPRLSGL